MEGPLRPPVLAIPPGVRPTIVCPDWCTEGYDAHVADLGQWEGLVIHRSTEGPVWHSRVAYPDGTPDQTEEPLIQVTHPRAEDGMTIEQARELLEALSAAIEEASR
ncbi:hypothetical protein [Nocardioides sp. J54]|uniref:hypothetical protein n=1 Tax=Nocardioides sp. J54 TaxID=935866 RepID=UPI00049099D8|nr:hypothetical protein [Nocardioides sp. J54]